LKNAFLLTIVIKPNINYKNAVKNKIWQIQ